MIRSMTGYGSAEGMSGRLGLTVELRAVNNRYLDCTVRIPRIYLFAEDAVKKGVSAAVSRGKVEVAVSVDSSVSDDFVININRPLLTAYVNAFETMQQEFGITNDLTASAVSKLPDVLTVEKQQTDTERFTADLCEALGRALDEFNRMRIAEGEKLKSDILGRLVTIEGLLARVEERSPQTVAEYRSKLLAKMQEILGSAGVDESRILTEAAVYADKVAVDEETVRLHSHIAQMRDIMESDAPVGRKLDFLVQEFNREANTIGSKCSDLEISEVVIDIKAEIEKIREQVQNIE